MEVRRVYPDDDEALAEWCAVLRASDADLWPDLTGFTLPDIRAFARLRGVYRRYDLLAAGDTGGPILGVGMMECALRDNRHCAEVTVAVHPDHRRRGVGTAIVERLGQLAVADGRQRAEHHCRRARGAGRRPCLGALRAPGRLSSRRCRGTRATSSLPVDDARLDDVREVVAGARDAAAYRTFTFVSPWPDEVLEDQCELLRRMSTDEPAGDGGQGGGGVGRGTASASPTSSSRPEEPGSWPRSRSTSASGRLVAFTELLLARDTPGQAWQLATLVHPDHRGHRLGLAVKVANLDFLAARAPAVQARRHGQRGRRTPR